MLDPFRNAKLKEFCTPVTADILKELLKGAWMDNWVSHSWLFIILHFRICKNAPSSKWFPSPNLQHISIVADHALLVSDTKEAGCIVIFFECALSVIAIKISLFNLLVSVLCILTGFAVGYNASVQLCRIGTCMLKQARSSFRTPLD